MSASAPSASRELTISSLNSLAKSVAVTPSINSNDTLFDEGLHRLPREAFTCVRTLLRELQKHPTLEEQMDAIGSATDIRNAVRLRLCESISLAEMTRHRTLKQIYEVRELQTESKRLLESGGKPGLRPHSVSVALAQPEAMLVDLRTSMRNSLALFRSELAMLEAVQDLELLRLQQTWLYQDDVELQLAIYSKPVATQQDHDRKMSEFYAFKWRMAVAIRQYDEYIADKQQYIKQLQLKLKQEGSDYQRGMIDALEPDEKTEQLLMDHLLKVRQDQAKEIEASEPPKPHAEPTTTVGKIEAALHQLQAKPSEKRKRRKRSHSTFGKGQLETLLIQAKARETRRMREASKEGAKFVAVGEQDNPKVAV